MTTVSIPVGTSEPYDFELRDDGDPINGSGFDVGLAIYDGAGVAVEDDLPTVAWLSQSAGTVRVTNLELLPVDQYFVRFTLTNALDEIGYVPNGAKADVWKVVVIPGR